MPTRSYATVITKNYLAHARVLAESLRKHDPGSELYVLLADEPEGFFDPKQEPFHCIALKDLADQGSIRRMSFYYTAFEFSNALKAFLHDYILSKTQASSWVYFDSDILVTADTQPIFDCIARASIVLNPHIMGPVPPAHTFPVETSFLRCGMYNGGFLGLRRTDSTKAFVKWFTPHLIWYAFDSHFDTYVDQKWLDLVPLYFEDHTLLRHVGANIAYWNFHERNLTAPNGQICVDGEAPLFVHLSGWRITDPEQVSVHARQYIGKAPPGWAALGRTYRDALLRHGYEEIKKWPYSWSHFANGETIMPHMRRQYHADLLEGNAINGSPFEAFDYFRPPPVRDSKWKKFIPSRVRSAGRILLRGR